MIRGLRLVGIAGTILKEIKIMTREEFEDQEIKIWKLSNFPFNHYRIMVDKSFIIKNEGLAKKFVGLKTFIMFTK